MPKTSRYFHYFYSLRHSHVALLLHYGVDVYAISKRLGHADLTTTTRKYSYLIDEFKAKSDDHIEDLLNNFSTKKRTKKFYKKLFALLGDKKPISPYFIRYCNALDRN